jgi:SP family arabinose:H+ symporter-like MFS transporter
MKTNWYLISMASVCAMGGLLFGYDWVVIGGAKPFYEGYFGIAGDPVLQGWAMSCALVGCLIGAAVSGRLGDRFGRKPLLIAAAALFVITSIATGAANAFSTFVLARVLGGVAIGLASNLAPLYIAEISPASSRGKYVSINQLTIVVGILLAQFLNWRIAEPVVQQSGSIEFAQSWNCQTGWRVMFWACAVPAAFFFSLMWIVPESPRWLARRASSRPEAKKILARIGGEEHAAAEMAEIEATLTAGSTDGPLSALMRPGLRKILVIGIIIAVFQQWSGINVIFNYAQEVFSTAGYGVSDILFNIVITGSVNLVFTFAGMFAVDRIGRKALMLVGAGGLALLYGAIGAMYFFHQSGVVLLALVVAAIGCYAMTLAPVTWVILSEIFPNRVRGTAMSVATLALWAACFVLTYTFPLLNATLQASGTFWLYGVICVAGFAFIAKRLPETKGKSLEALETELTA